MANETITTLIDDIVQTTQDADRMITAIEKITEALYVKPHSFEEILSMYLTNEKKERILDFIQNKNGNNFSKEALRELLDTMKTVIRSKSVLSLTIAFEPKKETLDRISNWCSESLGYLPLVKVQVDPSILGGIILTTGGYYRDYSLKNILKAKQDSIMGKFEHYA